MSRPFVSVIIPTFNREQLVGYAIESVLAQTYHALEVVVVDDGSTDATADVVRGYADSRLRYLPLEHRGMPAPARNAGIAVTTGSLVAFLDSDDAWLPDKLARQVEVLRERPEVGLICTNAERIDDRHVGTGPIHTPDNFALGDDPLARLLRGNFIVASSVLCRRDVLDRAGPFSENPRLRAVEDYEQWLRCGALASIAYLPEPLTRYRVHASGISTIQSRRNYADALLHVHALARELLGARPSLRRALERNRLVARRADYKARLAEGQWFGAAAPWLEVNMLKLKSSLDRLLAPHHAR